MKAILTIPYFGKFPNYFQIMLNSCEPNYNFTWLIYTDNYDKYDYPKNVIVKHITFDEMKNYILSKFDFLFNIDSVHKLCDFKPAYGYIFEEDIKGYDFWGYCDIDLIWGNLNHFITKEIIDKYDKIYTLGHLTLFRNTYENNRRFMYEHNGSVLYRKAFSQHSEMIFDEGFSGSINNIFSANGFPMYISNDCADIYTKSSNFRLVTYSNDHQRIVGKNKKGVFWWKSGNLIYAYFDHNNYVEEEYAYIHLQKRKMKLILNNLYSDSIRIVPNVIAEQLVPINSENFHQIKKKYFNLHYLRLRGWNLKCKIVKKVERYVF